MKVRAKNNWEIQLDLEKGTILKTAFRRSDIIEQLHDGSWFHVGQIVGILTRYHCLNPLAKWDVLIFVYIAAKDLAELIIFSARVAEAAFCHPRRPNQKHSILGIF